MAVLLGKDIFNIAELCEKEVLKSLVGTDFDWLYNLLLCLNTGNVDEFKSLCDQYDIFRRFQMLSGHEQQLENKVRIVAFLDLIFHKDKDERILTFDEIGSATKVGNDIVELLVMKTMSIGLVKGVIDEVEKTVRVTWVQPRLLSKEKIGFMIDKLASWKGKCEEAVQMLEEHCTELVHD